MTRGTADRDRCRWAEEAEHILRLTLVLACVMSRPLNAQSNPTEPGLTLGEAIAQTVHLDAQIARAQWAMQESHGAFMRAQGAFDLMLTTSAVRRGGASPSGSSNPSETITQYDIGFDQRLRMGIVVTPEVTLQRSQLPSSDLSSALNVADMGITLTVPLFRGRGGGLVTAGEDATRWARRASVDALEHQRAVSVVTVVQAYWGYVAATRRMAVLRDAEDRAQRLLEETRTLIEANERPRADEIRVRANYASKHASRLSGEAALIDARGALAAAMGVSRESLMSLPRPTTPLPDLSLDTPLPTAMIASELALERRQDLVAAQNRSEAAAALFSGAESESRPRFDLSLGLDYGGAAAGSPLDAFSAGQGVRTSLGFSFGLPFQNRDATGFELQEQARLRQKEIERSELARQIALDATTAADRLSTAAALLSRAKEAAELSEEDVRNEESRYRLGASTLFDLFFAQDALTAAALGELDAKLSYATSLARLRFETATLFQGTGDSARVDVNALLTWSNFLPRGEPSLRPRTDRDTAEVIDVMRKRGADRS